MNSVTKISVCICTFRRPGMLGNLLASLQAQETGGAFTYDIVVVDNDIAGSAAAAVAEAAKKSAIPIRYAVEPEQNISLARNRALRLADGDFAACLDDDELADRFWLAHLLREAVAREADVVLGPVLPSYETAPPRWVTKGKIMIRESFPTGTILTDPGQTRSGNFLIRANVIRDNSDLFQPEFGKLGGEDTNFFGRLIRQGRRLTWCDEARAYETIPAARLKRTYVLRRSLLTGVIHAGQAPFLSLDTLKSFLAFLLYSLSLPVVVIARPRWLMPCLMKDCHHIARIAGRLGVDLVKNRPD